MGHDHVGGIVFDVRFRQNNDCPVCHSGEHMEIEP